MRLAILIIFQITLCCVASAQEYSSILSSNTTYRIISNSQAEIQQDLSILIKSEKAKELSILQDYIDKFKSIQRMTVEIIDSQGKKVKRLTKESAITIGIHSSYEIDDSKYVFLDPHYQNYPYTLKISTVNEYHGFISLPPWIPMTEFNQSLKDATLTIIMSKGIDVNIWNEGVDSPQVINEKEGSIVKVYHVSNLPSVDKRIHYKDFFNSVPKVYVAPTKFELSGFEGDFTSWKNFGNWFLRLNSDAYSLTPETQLYLRNLEKTDTLKLISDVYQYMQKRTRYVSLQLGIGGFKSMPTLDVDTKGYGDCKALTNYLKNMLDFVGINSNFILVRAGDDVPDVKKEYTMNQFNHVFLAVPFKQDTLLYECTSQTSPANFTGVFTDDRNVLWVSKDASKICRSRILTANDNVEQSTVVLSLDQAGNGEVELTTKHSGIFFEDYFIYTGAPKEYVKKLNDKKNPFRDYTVKDFKFSAQNESSPPVFTTLYNLHVNGLAKSIQSRLVLPVNPLHPVTNYIEYNDFLHYGNIQRAFTIEDRIEINIGELYWVDKLPTNTEITSAYGYYQSTASVDYGKLTIKRKFMFKKGMYLKEEFDAFKKYIDSLVTLEFRKIVLNSKT